MVTSLLSLFCSQQKTKEKKGNNTLVPSPSLLEIETKK
jgi:hypothetical protein